MREREAMEQYAKQLVEENQQLKNRTDQSHNALIEQQRNRLRLNWQWLNSNTDRLMSLEKRMRY